MTDRDRMDPRLAAGLETVLTAQIQQDTATPAAGGGRQGVHRRRTVWVTAVVGLVVVVAAIVSIRVSGNRADLRLPAATPTRDARIESSLLRALPKPSNGTVVHTWTDQDPGGTGPFHVTGSTVVIAAVCQGGGAVMIHDAGGKRHLLVCNRQVVQQPFWRGGGSGAGDDSAVEAGPVHASVTVERGQPRFVVRMWKVDPRTLRGTARIGTTSSTVPASLRTCTIGDLAPTGTLTPLPGESAGVVTVTNRSSTDCAIRSWPGMTYLDSDGTPIGPTWAGTDINGRSVDSREGSLDRFQEFPPARLTAGGKGYLIADLYTRTRLEADDTATRTQAARAAATPSPSASFHVPAPVYCHPVTIASLRFLISGSTITVPAPTNPARAACTSANVAFGVNPVVTTNPAKQ